MQIIAFPDCLLGLDRLYTLYRSSIATLRQQGLHRQSRTDRWKLQVQGVRWICSVLSAPSATTNTLRANTTTSFTC